MSKNIVENLFKKFIEIDRMGIFNPIKLNEVEITIYFLAKYLCVRFKYFLDGEFLIHVSFDIIFGVYIYLGIY